MGMYVERASVHMNVSAHMHTHTHIYTYSKKNFARGELPLLTAHTYKSTTHMNAFACTHMHERHTE